MCFTNWLPGIENFKLHAVVILMVFLIDTLCWPITWYYSLDRPHSNCGGECQKFQLVDMTKNGHGRDN